MKKKRIILPIAAACALVAVVLTFRISFSYLMDAERKDNVITIGNVDVELSEPSYTDSSIVAAGDAPPKNPLLINKGTEDEYVFLRIAVPKKNVTLLYESNIEITENDTTTSYPKGTPTVKNRDASGKPQASMDEIFRFIAEGDLTSKVTEMTEPNTEPQLDFAYNAGHKNEGGVNEQADTEGWVYLYRKIGAEAENDDYNYYYFGYNKVLKYDSNQKNPSETKTLFDRVQLKSFIDEELVSGENSKYDFPPSLIKVKGYGVQSDSLRIEDLPGRNEILTKEQLEKIFGIVSRKAGET